MMEPGNDKSSIQGMVMTCPSGWQDKSMLILSAPAPGASGVTANMVVTRDRWPPDLPAAGPRIEALLDRHVEQMQAQLAGFKEVSRRVDAAGTIATAELKVDWHNAQARLTQRLTYVDVGEGMLMVATATTGRGEFADHDATFREMLQSFRTG